MNATDLLQDKVFIDHLNEDQDVFLLPADYDSKIDRLVFAKMLHTN